MASEKKISFLVSEFVYMKYLKMNSCLVINKMNLFKIITLHDIGSVPENLGWRNTVLWTEAYLRRAEEQNSLQIMNLLVCSWISHWRGRGNKFPSVGLGYGGTGGEAKVPPVCSSEKDLDTGAKDVELSPCSSTSLLSLRQIWVPWSIFYLSIRWGIKKLYYVHMMEYNSNINEQLLKYIT